MSRFFLIIFFALLQMRAAADLGQPSPAERHPMPTFLSDGGTARSLLVFAAGALFALLASAVLSSARKRHSPTHAPARSGGAPSQSAQHSAADTHPHGAGQLAALAHIGQDLRAPLSGMMGACQQLAQTHLSEQQQELLGLLERSGQAFGQLLDDMVDFSQLQAGQLRLIPRPIGLVDTLEDAVALLTKSAHHNGLTLVCDLHMDHRMRVHADPVRLQQVLYKLVLTSHKQAQGHVHVQGRAHTRSGQAWLHLSVQQAAPPRTGLAAHAATDPRLMAPTDPATVINGQPLGTHIAHDLVRLLNGTLQTQPSEHGGVVMQVRMPLPLVAHQPSTAAPAWLASQRPLARLAVGFLGPACQHSFALHLAQLHWLPNRDEDAPLWLVLDTTRPLPGTSELPPKFLGYVALSPNMAPFLPPHDWPMAPIWLLDCPPRRGAIARLLDRLWHHQHSQDMLSHPLLDGGV